MDAVKTDSALLQLSQEELIKEINEKYRDAMATRFTINMRVAKRMTLVIRGLIAIFALLLISLFLLISMLTQHTNEINNTINTINFHFTSMTKDMHEMRLNVASMKESMDVMPIIIGEVNSITSDVSQMANSIDSLTIKMNAINQHMSTMDRDILTMSNTLSQLDGTVHRIDVDVHNLSSPMRSY